MSWIKVFWVNVSVSISIYSGVSIITINGNELLLFFWWLESMIFNVFDFGDFIFCDFFVFWLCVKSW